MTDIAAWIALTILLLEVTVLNYFDRRMLQTNFTPFAFLSIPATAIAIIAATVGPLLGFVAIDAGAIWVWIGGLGLFWLSALLVTIPFRRAIAQRGKIRAPFHREVVSGKLLWPVAFVVVGLVLWGVVTGSSSEMGGAIGSTEFRSIAGTGLIGHASVFGMVLTIFLLGTTKKLLSWKTGIGLALAALSLIYGVKGWLFMPLLAAMIYRILSGRLKLSLWLLLLVCVVGYLLFISVYLLRYFVHDLSLITNPDIYDFVTKHFFAYMFAGWLGQSEAIRIGYSAWWPGDPRWVFSSILNLFGFFFGGGNFVSAGASYEGYLFTIGATNGEVSNVMTLFGNLQHNLGTLGMMGYTVGLSIITNMLFVFATINRNAWIGVAWCFVGAMLIFGWFDLYFYTLNALEAPVLAIATAAVIHLLIQKSQSPPRPQLETSVYAGTKTD